MLLTYRTAVQNLAKSRQKIWPEPDLAGFAKKGCMPDLLELKYGKSHTKTNKLAMFNAQNCIFKKKRFFLSSFQTKCFPYPYAIKRRCNSLSLMRC